MLDLGIDRVAACGLDEPVPSAHQPGRAGQRYEGQDGIDLSTSHLWPENISGRAVDGCDASLRVGDQHRSREGSDQVALLRFRARPPGGNRPAPRVEDERRGRGRAAHASSAIWTRGPSCVGQQECASAGRRRIRERTIARHAARNRARHGLPERGARNQRHQHDDAEAGDGAVRSVRSPSLPPGDASRGEPRARSPHLPDESPAAGYMRQCQF